MYTHANIYMRMIAANKDIELSGGCMEGLEGKKGKREILLLNYNFNKIKFILIK